MFTAKAFVAVLGRNHSVAYFDRIIVLKALQRGTSVKGGVHTRYVDLSGVHASLLRVSALPLMEVCTTVLQTQ